MRSLVPLALLALPLAGPAAQEPEAGEAAALQPLLRLACDGPAAFRQAFLATNVGGLLGADETQPLIRPVQGLLLQAFGEQRETLWPQLRDYRGRMELSVFVRPAERDREVQSAALLRMTGDGETDMDLVVTGLTALLRKLGGEEASIELDGDDRTALRQGKETLVLPFRAGEGLWIAYATDPVSQLEEVVAAAIAAPLARARGASPVEVDLDLQQTAAVAMHAEGMDEDDRRFGEVIWGLSSLRSFQARVGPAGPQVMVEVKARFDPGPLGILKGFLPDVQEAPGMIHLVPEDCPAWKDGRLRLDQVVDAFLDAVAHYLHDGDREPIDEDVARELGFHIVDDLLAYLGNEVLWLGGPWRAEEGEGRGRIFMPFEGTCLVFRIDKREAFAESWPKARNGLLKSLGVTPDTVEHEGVEIHGGSAFLAETSLWLAAVDGLGFLAFGDRGRELLESALERRDAEPGELPPAVQRVRRQAPPGFNGAARADLEAVFDGQLGLLAQLLDEMLLDLGYLVKADSLVAGLEPYARLLARHGLDQVVTLTGYANGTWTFRVLW